MKKTCLKTLTVSMLSSAIALVGLLPPASAQTPAKAPTGLDSLDDMNLYAELGTRELKDLLARSYDLGKVSPEQRKQIETAMALNTLLNQPVEKMTAKQRRDIVSGLAAGGLDKALATIKDPVRLSRVAAQIFLIGVQNESSLLEFWGEDPATQAQLRPAAESVVKIYAKAEAEATAKMNTLSNQLVNANQQALIDQLDRLQAGITTIQYTKMSSQYFVALSLDKADTNRAKLCDETIEFLKQYDTPESGIQATVRLQTGKLLLVKGTFDEAVTALAAVDSAQPAATTIDKSNARLFSILSLMLGGKLDEAEKMLTDVLAWQKATLTNKDEAQAGSDAAAVAKARIAWARAEAAKTPADKSKFNDQAAATLTQLMNERPALRPLILGILVKRLPDNPDVTKLDVLLLQAIIQGGRAELPKDPKAGDKLDTKAIEKSISAARELLKRKEATADKQLLSNTQILIALFAKKLDQPKVAAAGFLDYAESQKTADAQRATQALDEAMGLILNDLQGGKNAEADVVALYERAIPLAIAAPFNHVELSYDWARRLQGLKKYDEAIKYFQLVPPADPRALNAKYWTTVSLNVKLDDPKLDAKARTAISNDILKTADDVIKGATDGLAKATDEKKKNSFRQMLVGTRLLAAQLAMDQKDAAGALQKLENFEAATKGLPNEEELLAESQGILVRGYMELGENKKATDLLIDYAKKRPNQAIGLVIRMKDRLGKDLAKAQAANDRKTVMALLPVRAELTGFMAKYAKTSTDPKVKEAAFGLEVIDADAKREAAAFESDPAKKKAYLLDVQKILDGLRQQPQGQKDATLALYLGLTNYELGEFQKTIDLILPLLQQRKLGSATKDRMVNGQLVVEDNELYWEGRLKVLRSFVEVAKQKNDTATIDQSKKELRLLYTANGKNTGGEKFRADFEKLRLELDPTIPADGEGTEATTQPTTRPGTVD